jgi:hypothetical protein
MRCQLVALCEAANTTADGKINILGEFDTLHFQMGQPLIFPTIVFVAKVKAQASELGQHTVQLRVMDEDEQLVAMLLDARAEMANHPTPGVEAGLPLIIPVHNAKFPALGTYRFQLVLDGEVLTEAPIHVTLKTQPA